MSSDKENKPNFYIFGIDANGESKPIGAVFNHQKGKGFNILIEQKRYVAFPTKNQAEIDHENTERTEPPKPPKTSKKNQLKP